MSKKKKEGKSLVLLVLVLLLLILAYFFIIKRERDVTQLQEDKIVEATSLELWYYSIEDIKQLTIKNEKDIFTLYKEEDKVKFTNDPDMPLSQGYGNNMFTAVQILTADQSIGEQENLDEYGLESPIIEVEILGVDNNRNYLYLGDSLVTGSGRYARINDSKEVYLLGAQYYTYFNYSQEDMVLIETIPSVTYENITEITISKEEETYISLTYDESIESDLSGANFWTLDKVYNKPMAASVDGVLAYQENFSSIAFLKCIDYNAIDVSVYGLDKPTILDIKYYDLSTADTGEEVKDYKELELHFGKEENGFYYTRLASSTAVHTMSVSNVDKLLKYDYYTLVNRFVSLINIKKIDTIQIEEVTGNLNFSIEEVKKEGEEESTFIYTKDENVILEEEFKKFYQSLIGITYDKEFVDGMEGASRNQATYRITYNLIEGTQVVVEFVKINDSYYLAVINNEPMFTVDKRMVDQTITQGKEL